MFQRWCSAKVRPPVRTGSIRSATASGHGRSSYHVSVTSVPPPTDSNVYSHVAILTRIHSRAVPQPWTLKAKRSPDWLAMTSQAVGQATGPRVL